MSEPRLISPLLDGYAMGRPISNHNGVRCCPAMQDNSDNKYIVKIISIPASQIHTDALLLSGAYRNRAAVKAYYKELADGVVQEAEVLQNLSKLEGFLAYDQWQMVSMESETGYDIYLISRYKRSLERYFAKKPMTHLGAVNLGLDLCAALSVCRQLGYLYVNLKPANVFITDEQRYKIGDLGLIPLSSLNFASLPDRYRSSWTAPEIADSFASLNTTIDIYAAGLILYQAYNNGQLPFQGSAPADPLPPPEYADYEMAEIILKACAADPKDRWQTPVEMGQALVAYMQRNRVNDTPIVPPVVEVSEPLAENDIELETEADDTAEASDAEAENIEEAVSEEAAEPDPLPAEEAPAETDSSHTDDPGDLRFIEELISDETAPTDESIADMDSATVSDETSEMLAQADELIAHETPDPVVAPEPIEVPMPEPIPIEEDSEAPIEDANESENETETADTQPEPAATEEAPAADDAPVPVESSEESEYYEEDPPKSAKKKLKSFLITLLCLLLATAVTIGGYYLYKTYYLMEVDSLVIDGTDSQFTVTIRSDIPDEMLTVVYTDIYGNAKRLPVENGSATATDLAPSSVYKITLEVDGFHKLDGSVSGSYTTSSRTNIVSLTAITGSEDGSAIVSFTVDGTDTENWTLTYSTEGEEQKTVNFSGHMTTIRELTVGKEYTFQLSPASDLVITGQTQITHTASKIITAEDLKVDACHSGSMTVSWKAPDGVNVSGWSVRCYNANGYDQTINTTETSAVFSGIVDNETYTIEATAAGMTLSSNITMTSTPVEITAFHVSTDDPTTLNVSWDAVGNLPQTGWVVNYSIDDGDQAPLECNTNNAVISPAIPGARYEIVIHSADGITVFNGTLVYDVPAAEGFDKYGISTAAGGITFSMYSESGVYSSDGAFPSGEAVYLNLETHGYYEIADSDIQVLYVIRDDAGRVLHTGADSFVWSEMWWNSYFEAPLPELPTQSGNYSIDIFFDRMFATSFDFSIG